MHFGTNEIFQGTFKKTTLEKVLKFGKLPVEVIQRVMMAVQEVPLDPGEVAIAHVIITLANPILLETRKPFKVLDKEQKLIAVGLANDVIEAEKLLHWHTPNISIVELQPSEYNSLVSSTDLTTIRTFGLGREF